MSTPRVTLLALTLAIAACGRDEATTTSDAAATSGTPAIDRSSVAGNPAGWPPIEFEPASLDFGLLTPGGAGNGDVRIWNVGATPLRILASATSCGCTTADALGQRVVPPGASIEFGTSMKMKSGLGQKHEQVRIVFEGYTDVTVAYDLRAEVALPVRATPPHLAATETLSGTFEIASLDGQPFRVLASNNAAPVFVGFDPEKDASRSRYTLAWKISPTARKRDVPWFWVVETDRPDAPLVDLRVRHEHTRPYRRPGQTWVAKDQRVLVPEIENGVPIEIETSIEYGEGQRPTPEAVGVVSTTSSVSVELGEVRTEGQLVWIRMFVTPRDAPPGLLTASLRVMGGAGSMSELFVIGRVR